MVNNIQTVINKIIKHKADVCLFINNKDVKNVAYWCIEYIWNKLIHSFIN